MKKEITVTNMRIERVKKNTPQKEVADYLGVSQQYYNFIERLKTKPSAKRIQQLEEFYNKDIDYLLTKID